jgi:hypothetical protein
LFELKKRSNGLITTKTAADLATSIAVGLLTPITSQIDPLRLGEVQRALNVATEYGRRLGADEKTLTKLTSSYPSHSFIIDFGEVREILNARRPTQLERVMELEVEAELRQNTDGNCLRVPASVMGTLTDKPKPKKQRDSNEDSNSEQRKDGANGKKSRKPTARTAAPEPQAIVKVSHSNGETRARR